MLLTALLGTLALLSLGLTLWQWAEAVRFPLHRRVADRSHAPGVTLLKPLKGCDAETLDCLRSWLRQDYAGPVQVLFGVASAEDPVCAMVGQVAAEFPQADAQLVLCPESLGANAKVSTLAQLERQARHEVVVISDADVYAPPDLLTNVVAPLREPVVGLVNCFYRFARPANLAMRWEAVAVNADFWSQVLQARSLQPLDFALGAVMVTPRSRLAAIGGFAALADFLADDYQLGRHIARAGGQIVFSPVVAECRCAPMRWREVWQHQLRWARTIRVCRPLPYGLSVLSNASLWPLAWLAAAPAPGVAAAVAVCLAVRVLSAQHLQRKLGAEAPWRFAWVPVMKDLLQVGLWGLAFLGTHVVWRGQRFRVLPGGRLVKT